MLAHVVDVGRKAASAYKNTDLIVATEDERIATHCRDLGVTCFITSENCATGSDRVLEAADKSGKSYDILMSLQGDAPFTPVTAIGALLDAFEKNSKHEVVTPVVRLRWSELNALREAKRITPFSGTVAIVQKDGTASWFSKSIIPAMRDEASLRKNSEFSPVLQHLGLYAYRTDILRRFVAMPQGNYERLEGLEQLRFLENNIKIHAVTIETDLGLAQAGIDSPEDVIRAEKLLGKAH